MRVCKFCGNEMSEDEEYCSRCGMFPPNLMENTRDPRTIGGKVCPSCQIVIPIELKSCPKCRYKFPKIKNGKKEPISYRFLTIALIVLLIGALVFVILFKKRVNEVNSNVPITETVATEKFTIEPTLEPTTEPTSEPTEYVPVWATLMPTQTVVDTTEVAAETALAKADQLSGITDGEFVFVIQPVETETPTSVPTEMPTAEPTAVPTEEPTATPTAEPTAVPTEEPTATPTAEPTAIPMEEPTATPALKPTETPSMEATEGLFALPDETQMPTMLARITDEKALLERERALFNEAKDARGETGIRHYITSIDQKTKLVSGETACEYIEGILSMKTETVNGERAYVDVRFDKTNGFSVTIEISVENSEFEKIKAQTDEYLAEMYAKMKNSVQKDVLWMANEKATVIINMNGSSRNERPVTIVWKADRDVPEVIR